MLDPSWMTVAVITFWGSALLIAYAYVGYPLLMHVLGRLRTPVYARGDVLPTVSFIVPAYNEAHVFQAKIENSMALDYPADRLEILLASDGSTDGTAEIIRDATGTGRIRGLLYKQRRGKAAVLNDLVRLASGEIIVFSDAASMLELSSLRALVANFADPRVGCVSGIYRILKPSHDGQGKQDSLYWRYETFVRMAEARLGSMVGAHGALYAIRRDLFEPLAPNVINDDGVIPTMILLKGFDTIYEPRAVASEDAREMAGFARRIRTMTGNYQQVALLLKKRGGMRKFQLVFQLLSHKGLRVLMPLLMVALYASNALLLAEPGYRLAFMGQSIFFFAGLLGVSARLRRMGRAPVAIPYYVCMAHFAALVALFRLAVRRDMVGWG